MQPNNVTAYTEYFRQLAVSHKDLQHDINSESGNAGQRKKRFALFKTEELISGLSNDIGFPSLLLELYEIDLSNETVYDIRQSAKGGFMVVEHAKENDFADQLRAYATAEGIMYDIMKKIWMDHYGSNSDMCTRRFKQFRFNGSIIPTGKVFDNEYGYYCQFGFDFQNSIDITQPPANGTFF